MADKIGMQIGIEFDFKSANTNLQKLLKQLEKSNKLGLVIDTKKFDQVTREYERLKQRLQKDNITPNVDVSKVKSSMSEINSIAGNLVNRQIKLVDGEQTQRIYKINQALGETKRVIQDLKKNKTTEIFNYDYSAKDKLEQQIEIFKKQTQIQSQSLLGRYDGLIDKDKMNGLLDQVNKLSATTPKAQHEMKKLALGFKELEVNAKNSKGALDTSNKQAISLSSAFSTAWNKMVVWMGTATVFMQIVNFVKGTVTAVSGINKSLTDLAKVSELSMEQLEKFAYTANEIGINLSKTTTEVLNSVAAWQKMGYSIKDATELAKESLLLSSVGDIGQEDANKFLLTSIKGFGKEISDARTIIDGMNQVSNRHALTINDLGQAYERFSSAMSASKNSIGESTALFTGAQTVIQNAESVSNGLRTIALRMQGVDDEGKEFKELVPALEQDFKRLGLTLYDADGGLKSTYQTFKDLSTVYDKLSDMERIDILEKISGKRQVNISASILQNWSEVEKALSDFNNSSGSAAVEFDRYSQSVEGYYKRLLGSLDKLRMTLLNSGTLKFFLEQGKSIIDNVTALGKLNIAFTIAAVAVGKFALAQKGALITSQALQVTTEIGGFKKLSADIGIAIRALLGFKTSADVATVSATALNIATGALLLGIPLLAMGIGQIVKSYNERINKNMEAVNAMKSETAEIDKLIIQKEKLDGIENKNDEQKQQLIETEKRIAELLPQSTTEYTKQNEAVAQNIEVIKKLNDEKKKTMATKAMSVYESMSPSIEKDMQRLEEYTRKRDELLKKRTNGESISIVGSKGAIAQASPEEIASQLNKYQEMIDSLTDKRKKYNEAVQAVNAILGTNYQLMDDDSQSLKDNTQAVEDNSKAVKDNAEAKQSNAISATEILSNSQKRLGKIMEDAETTIKPLNEALAEYDKLGRFNISTIMNLAKTYPELLNLMNDEGAMQKYLIQAKNGYIDTVVSAANKEIEIETQKVNKLAQVYNIQISNLVATYRTQANFLKSIMMEKMTGTLGAESFENQMKELWAMADALEQAKSQLKTVGGNIGKVGNPKYDSGSSSKDKAKKENDDKIQAAEWVEGKIVEIIKKRYEQEAKLAEENHKKQVEQYDKDLKEYTDYINEKIKKLDEQYEKEDYEKGLKKEKQKALDIKRQIDELMLDSSREAQARRNDLMKILEEQNQAIADMEEGRNRDLRKQSLQDDLDAYQKKIEGLKNAEDERYEQYKKDLELKSSEAQLHLEAKRALMNGTMLDVNGNMVTLVNAFMDFQKRFGDGLGILGNQIQKEFIDKLNQAKSVINSMGNVSVSASGVKGSYANGGIVDYTGLAMVHGGTNPELMLNGSHIEGLWNFIKNLPRVGMPKYPQLAMSGVGGGVAFSFDNLINVNGNVDRTVMPKLEDITNQVCKELNKYFPTPLRRR